MPIKSRKVLITLTSKENATKIIIIATLSDDAVMQTIHHLVDIGLQF